MKKSAILLTAVLTVAACNYTTPDGGPNKIFLKSLVDAYYPIDCLFVETTRIYIIDSPEYVQAVRITPGATLIPGYLAYNRLMVKHGDTAFNYHGTVYPTVYYLQDAVAEDFNAINVVSASDFDPQHPAGTSLADIVEFRTMSPKRFIDSRYTEEYPDEKQDGDFLPHHVLYKWFYPVHKLMSEVTPEDMTMMGATEWAGRATVAAFRFTRQPTAPGKHDMTLTMTTDEGKVYTANFTVDFE